MCEACQSEHRYGAPHCSARERLCSICGAQPVRVAWGETRVPGKIQVATPRAHMAIEAEQMDMFS